VRRPCKLSCCFIATVSQKGTAAVPVKGAGQQRQPSECEGGGSSGVQQVEGGTGLVSSCFDVQQAVDAPQGFSAIMTCDPVRFRFIVGTLLANLGLWCKR
jgi:hypothetical protein